MPSSRWFASSWRAQGLGARGTGAITEGATAEKPAAEGTGFGGERQVAEAEEEDAEPNMVASREENTWPGEGGRDIRLTRHPRGETCGYPRVEACGHLLRSRLGALWVMRRQGGRNGKAGEVSSGRGGNSVQGTRETGGREEGKWTGRIEVLSMEGKRNGSKWARHGGWCGTQPSRWGDVKQCPFVSTDRSNIFPKNEQRAPRQNSAVCGVALGACASCARGTGDARLRYGCA